MLLIITRRSQSLKMSPEERRRLIKGVTRLTLIDAAEVCKNGHAGCSDSPKGACLDEALGLVESLPSSTILAKMA